MAVVDRLFSPDESRMHDPFALVGEIVSGRFRVMSLRHTGPRAVVYEVEPPGVGQLRRALKVVNVAEAREPDVAERMRTVVRAMRDLDHPYLERVFDMGHLPDETPYVIAEWLPQVSLERVLQGRRRLQSATALEILLRATKACAVLHDRGVVHGDIRPNHVLVEMTGEEPADIRVVKLTDAGVPGLLNIGPVGGAAGQVAYLSPECLAGQPRQPASDVYALGVVAYRLLTQFLPYRPEDTRVSPHDRDPVSRVRWLHQNASPLRPSRMVSPADFSPEVEAVIGRAMAKSLVERYPDAGALYQALEQAVRAPAARAPGSVAIPIPEGVGASATSPTADLLPTEGTAPEVPAQPPTEEVPVLVVQRPEATPVPRVETPPWEAVPAAGPHRAYWLYAAAGAAVGILGALF